MFGLSELNAHPPQSIAVATRLGNEVDNAQGARVAAGQVQAFRDMCQRRRWDLRRDADGLYNCAGLVWASRRTGISRQADWDRILRDDGYRRVHKTEPLRPDDLVLYLEVEDNTYLHVARVIRLIPGVANGSPPIPIVLSKWGHNLGECIHNAYEHGMGSDFNVDILFWTDRPDDVFASSTTPSLIY
jgi:hypothetical protein